MSLWTCHLWDIMSLWAWGPEGHGDINRHFVVDLGTWDVGTSTSTPLWTWTPEGHGHQPSHHHGHGTWGARGHGDINRHVTSPWTWVPEGYGDISHQVIVHLGAKGRWGHGPSCHHR